MKEPQKAMRASVELSHWSGHGEGGTICRVVLTRPNNGDCYQYTPEDREQAEADAAYINDLIARAEAR